jgi:DNA-binding cell septation regulator SpoVG
MQVSKVFVTKRQGNSKLTAFADIAFKMSDKGMGCVTIRGFRVFKNDDGSLSVAFPTRQGEKDGNKEWYPVISIDKENTDATGWLDAITDAVVTEYNKSDEAPSNQSTKSKNVDDDIPF